MVLFDCMKQMLAQEPYPAFSAKSQNVICGRDFLSLLMLIVSL